MLILQIALGVALGWLLLVTARVWFPILCWLLAIGLCWLVVYSASGHLNH